MIQSKEENLAPGFYSLVDAVDVVGVDDAGSDEAAEELRQEVDGPASPGQLAPDAEVECHCWV